MEDENWEVVQKNKITGEEETFLGDTSSNTSKVTAAVGAMLRRAMVSSDKYDVFIRKILPVKIT